MKINDLAEIAAALTQNFDGQDILPDLRIYGVYTGDFQEPAANFGGLGFLPLAGTSTGDVLGLTPILKKEPSEWPVLCFSHSGGDAEIVSSRLDLLVSGSMARAIRPSYILEDKDEILENEELLLALADLLDDKQARLFIQYLKEINSSDDTRQNGISIMELAEGDTWLTAFLRTYEAVYVQDEDAIQRWTSFIRKYPFLQPAKQLLVGAELKKGGSPLEMAWECATSEPFFNNFILDLCRQSAAGLDNVDATDSANFDLLFEDDPEREIATYIVESGQKQKEPEYSAIHAQVAEEPAAALWNHAGETLLRAGQPERAYKAFLRGANAHYEEEGEFGHAAAGGALKAARELKDRHIVYLLESVLSAQESNS